MVFNDFGQNIQGLHLNGDAIVSTDRHIAIFGKDVANDQYIYIALDSNGQVELAHDVNTNPIFNIMTDGTGQDLDIYVEGDAGTTGLGVMGQDSLGNMQFLKVTTDGEVIVNIGAENTAFFRDSVTLVKDTIATVASLVGGPDVIVGVNISGIGLGEWVVEFGTTGSEVPILDAATTPANPNQYFQFPAPLKVSATQTIRVRATNREKAASPASDFTGFATFIKEA